MKDLLRYSQVLQGVMHVVQVLHLSNDERFETHLGSLVLSPRFLFLPARRQSSIFTPRSGMSPDLIYVQAVLY